VNREFHEVASLFPLLSGSAFSDLVVDIRQSGLLEPIVVDSEGRILDGRNRYRACLEAGVEPRFVEWKGHGPLIKLSLRLNLRRRHLNESQRAMVAARLAKFMERAAVLRKGTRTDLVANLQPGERRRSAHEAAARVNVSQRLVSYALKVLKNGCDELIAEVDSGELAVSAACLLTRLPNEELLQQVGGGLRALTAKVRELRGCKTNPQPDRPALGSFGVWGQNEPQPPHLAVAGPVALLWVPAAQLSDAILALRARGFHYTSQAA